MKSMYLSTYDANRPSRPVETENKLLDIVSQSAALPARSCCAAVGSGRTFSGLSGHHEAGQDALEIWYVLEKKAQDTLKLI